MIERNELEDMFYLTKLVITDTETKCFRFRTSNAGTKTVDEKAV